ncbi:CaiB/BaiF CoA-transferase family protein [Bradyrhizobium sp. LHD-71]|uniref:CaiB/BaiF CoA transferase family protein n=1 Tax=Bradyrhizobium sp. LHD-71 TaxID=3072141 RepID=UPI00280EDB36|nr:CaiB/BaiF CoA-transferase family protein [Bradyrhizobium sp. LHD-71]MDQ8728027.1 CaiB/BaiF CoA-transferase family protein [Bradyrhizobium sp. LHD-71]
MSHDAPLAGIRVLDIATFVAAPFCGTVLSDFGAEVIKIEQPGAGDPLRRFGTPSECGDTYVWLSEARNKKSVTLDLRTDRGASLFRELVRKSDVVLENFRPGTLEKWGLGFDALSDVNPKLVMLRISAYGQDGPLRDKPGFARIAHAFSGLAYLAGEPGRPPVMPGSTSLADYISGLWGAVGVMVALRHAEATGRGQVIDIGLYESVFRLLDEIATVYAKTGFIRERLGPDTVNVVPHSHYQTADGRWLALACSSDKMFDRLARAMRRPELSADVRYATMTARISHRDEVNALVADWLATMSLEQALAECDRHDVPCGPIYSISDIFNDPHYRARGNIAEVDSRAGSIAVPSAIPRMSRTPPRFRHAGVSLGAHTDEVLTALAGVSASMLATLRDEGVI